MTNFLIAENPMLECVETYIVHAIPPFTLIQAFPDSGRINVSTGLCHSFAFRNSQGVVEDWTLAILFSEAPNEQADKLLTKAWKWYRLYLGE